MHLIIPMAGKGSRFSSNGYQIPKPLLPIGQWRMYEIVIANLWSDRLSQLSLVTQRADSVTSSIGFLSERLQKPVNVFEVDHYTAGPACSVELAARRSEPNEPLVVANSDQFIDADLSDFYVRAGSSGNVGTVVTMSDSDPKWSFVQFDDRHRVEKIVEKQPVSRHATAGIYAFGRTASFLEALDEMKRLGDTTNGEFYVGPVYNYLANVGEIEIVHLGDVGTVMHGLGIPEDYERFIANKALKEKAVEAADILFGKRDRAWNMEK